MHSAVSTLVSNMFDPLALPCDCPIPNISRFSSGRKFVQNSINPNPVTHYPSSIYTHNRVMIDTGIAGMWPLIAAHIGQHDITDCILTHHHEDHSGNICNILTSNYHHLYPSPHNPPALPNVVKIWTSEGCLKILNPTGEHSPVFPMQFYEHFLYGKPSKWTIDTPDHPLSDYHPLSYPPNFAAESLKLNIIPGTLTLHDTTYHVHEARGHSPDQIAIHCPSANVFFSGDAYLSPETFFFRSDEDYDNATATMRRMIATPDWDGLLCGHMPVYKDGKEALKRKLEQHEANGVRIRELHAGGMAEEDIAAVIFPRATKQWPLFVFCGGDVSPDNIIRSCIHGGSHRSGVSKALKNTTLLL